MNLLQDRRIIAVIGAAGALLLALLIAVFAMRSHKPVNAEASPAAAGLQIEQGQADSRTTSTRQLRCFVGGQFVGLETVADCAAKNGVAAQALDVGLDPATGQATTGNGSLAPPVQAPPPPPPAAAPAPETHDEPAAPANVATADCLRYAPEGWRGAGGAVSLGQCARALFEGHCEHAGEALYGHWGQQTLRLVPGRVEMSSDNRSFHPLAAQNPQDCSLPAA